MQPPWPPPASPLSTAMSSPRCPGATAPRTRPTCGPCPDGGLACRGPAGIHRLDDDVRLRELPDYQRTACDWRSNQRALEVGYLDPGGRSPFPESGYSWRPPCLASTFPSVPSTTGSAGLQPLTRASPCSSTASSLTPHCGIPLPRGWRPTGSSASCPIGPSARTADRRTRTPTCRPSPSPTLSPVCSAHSTSMTSSSSATTLAVVYALALRGDISRVKGLVLTNCDAFEQFPPRSLVPLFILARSRLAVWTIAQLTRLRVVRHSPLGFGPLLNSPRSASLTRGWIQPVLDSAAIRRDVTRFARGMRRTELVDAATWLGQFEGPVRIVWGTQDKQFTIGLGRRLAAAFRQARLDQVTDATTFVSIDRPDAVVSAIKDVLANSAR